MIPITSYFKPFGFFQALLFLAASFCLLMIRYWIINNFFDLSADGDALVQRYQSIKWWQLVLLIPIVEELFFRYLLQGLIFHNLFPNNAWLAILLSAGLFGLAHWYLPMIIAAFIMGLFISWVFWKFRSLFAALFIHIANNCFIVYAQHFNVGLEKIAPDQLSSLPFLALFLTLLLLVVSLLDKTAERGR